jgi:hypothetical protein
MMFKKKHHCTPPTRTAIGTTKNNARPGGFEPRGGGGI